MRYRRYKHDGQSSNRQHAARKYVRWLKATVATSTVRSLPLLAGAPRPAG